MNDPGVGKGLVEVKTRLPISLHGALSAAADRNQRSLAAELRIAIIKHLAQVSK